MSHCSPITCVDHHLATDRRVTGGYDSRVVAWNPDGSERWFADFDDLVNDVRIDPTGTRVAVAVADRFAFVLDMANGARTDVFGPHGDDVNAVRWSPDASQLACVMDHLDTTIRIWPMTDSTNDSSNGCSGKSVALSGHESGVFAVAFDPTGTRVATVAEDSTARIWDIATGGQLHVLQHPGDPEALDWSPSGSVIVTGCDDGIARVWDPSTGLLVRELSEAKAAVRFIRFDATGARVLIGSYDATMRAYECRTWSLIESYRQAFQWERAGGFTNNGIVIGSFGAGPLDYPPTGKPLELTYGINAIAANNGRLLVGRDDGRVVDVLRAEILTQHDTIVNTVAISPNNRTVASGDYRGGVRVTPLQPSGEPAIVTRTADGGPINSIVWNPQGDMFYSGGYDGCVRTWQSDGTCTTTFDAHHGPIKSLAWSASAHLLIAGSSDGSLSAWENGREAWRATTDDLVLVNAVACADEAGIVVSASRDLRVRIWDAATGALIETLGQGHRKSVKAIAVSSDGKLILTGSYDGTAIMWHRGARGWQWTPLRLHGKPGVPAVALSEDALFTAGWNGTVGHWDLTGKQINEYLANEIH
jgi:WD40 repeat protein